VRVGCQSTAEIQEIFAWSLCRSSQVASREFFAEKLRNFRPYFIAAASDSGPDSNPEIGRINSKARPHVPDGDGQNVRKGPPPSGVDCRNGFCLGIRDQHRQAIGGLNRQGKAFHAGDERIRFWLVPLAGIIPYDIHTIGMNLV
jgi:hypothetical protein